MSEKKRVKRVEIGVMDRAKVVDVYATEFVCNAAGKVQGNLDAELAEVRGACKVGGDVRATILKVGGSMKVVGNVTAELVRAKGALKVEGHVSADHIRVSGATKVMGGITSAGEVMVQGVLKCAGDMVANRFKLLGAVGIDGRLTAKEFTAELGGKSTIRTIDSTIVNVKASSSSKDSELVSKRIAGSEIYLENTVAESVEGDRVTIGPGCTISEVKAREMEVHKSSKVGKRS